MIAAVLLLVCLSLPLATCTHYESADGKRLAVADKTALPAGAHEVTEYHYALEDVEPYSIDGLTVWAVFAGPLAFAVAIGLIRRRRLLVAARLLELPVLAWSCVGVYVVVGMAGEKIYYGGYLAFATVGICALAALTIDFLLLRVWWRERRRTA